MLLVITDTNDGSRETVRVASMTARETGVRSLVRFKNHDDADLGEIDLNRYAVEVLPEPKP
jgi:hypothetical protein